MAKKKSKSATRESASRDRQHIRRKRVARSDVGSGSYPADDSPVAGSNPAESGPPRVPAQAFPVVGIGASAGGLEALTTLFEHLPAENGMAFVVVPHLAPSHHSLMPELLSRQTMMPVQEVADGTQLQVNHVYVIPPNHSLIVKHGRLLFPSLSDQRGPYGTLDIFLESLAQDQQHLAVGIILSGTGLHGIQGLRAIKAAGGMVMVQDPGSARSSGMPTAAIDAGVTDYVLPPEEMPEVLMKYIGHEYVSQRTLSEQETSDKSESSDIHRIMALLRAHTKYDFRSYRKKMIMRRVARRMGLNQINSVSGYIQLLREQPGESQRLFQDLLIGVTEFFREPEAFEIIRQQVLPELLERTDRDTPVRVWVPGCSSGEETYSIVILLTEGFSAAGRELNLQIFGTDIDEVALEKARLGRYPENVLENVSTERRQRFFVDLGEQQFHVNKQLRESVVFAAQNLISDAPFSKLDLISCRNLLIYLEPEVQAKVIAMFHFALKPDGVLVLGPSETIGRAIDQFEPISPRWRVYRRIETVRPPRASFPIIPTTGLSFMSETDLEVPPAQAVDLDRLTEQLLLRNTPAAVLINHRYEVLNYHGPTGRYLEQPGGPPTDDLLSLVLEGLRTKLRTAVQQAVREEFPVVVEDARVKRNGKYHPVKFTVEPLRESKATSGLLLITFEDCVLDDKQSSETSERRSGAKSRESDQKTDGQTAVVEQLEFELKATRDDLQSTIEEQDSANEELKAANEEVMSMNEELQSANEELESSKEELQSLNEEMIAVNNQLEEKVRELEVVNDDINNLLQSSDIATLFLDRQFQIKRFTPMIDELFSLRAADIGRPIAEFARKFTDPDLLDDCCVALERLSKIEREVWSQRTENDAGVGAAAVEIEADPQDGQRCYIRRIIPYRTAVDRIDGVIVTFVDITERKRAELLVQEARLYAEGIVSTVREPTVVLDNKLQVQTANPAFYEFFRVVPKEIESRQLFEIGNRQWDIPELRTALEELLPQNTQIDEFQVDHQFERIGQRILLLNARRIHRLDNRPDEILLAFRDITQQESDRRALQERKLKLKAILDHTVEFIALLNPDGTVLRANRTLLEFIGADESEVIGQPYWLARFWNETSEQQHRLMQAVKCAAAGESDRFEATYATRDGGEITVDFSITPVRNPDGDVILLVPEGRNISERKRAEAEVRELNAQLEQRVADQTHQVRLLIEAISHLGEGVLITDDTLDWPGPRISFVNDAMCRITGYTVDELIGQSPRLLQGEETSEEVRTYIREELAAPRSCRVEVVNYRKDRTPYDAELFITPLFDATGHRTNFVSIHRDISERKQAERSLQESEARYRLLADNSADFVVMNHVDGRRLYVSPSFYRRSGWTPEEIQSTDWRTRIHPDDLETVEAARTANLRGETTSLEYRSLCQDGSWIWLDSRCQPVTGSDGEVETLILWARDVSERKLADQRVHDRDERLQAILNTAADSVVTIDQQGIIESVNRMTEQMFGYTERELVGQNIRLLMPSPYREEHDSYIARYLETGENRIICIGREVAGQRKDGSIFPVDLSVSEVDHLNLFTGIVRDISARKLLEREVLEIASEEQRRIGQDLHDGVGGELAGLGIIADTLLQTLSRGEPLAMAQDLAQQILQGLKQAITQVRTLSYGLVPVEETPHGLMDALRALVERTCSINNIDCSFDCPNDVLCEDAEIAKQLFHIAQEAVTNAVRHGKPRHLRISLERNDDLAILKIHDDGCGFASEKARQTATSLGLRSMQYRASQIGARLEIQSSPGNGTLVICTTPLGSIP